MLKVKILDNRGVTLIELLIVISLTSITLPIIYGVWHSGLKLYETIQYEGQMRDDADYVSSMILNKMYSMPFDSISYCGDTSSKSCIELVDSVSSKLDKYTSGSSTFYDIDQEAVKDEDQQSTIKIELRKDEQGRTKFYVNDAVLDVPSEFNGSEISFTCSNKNNEGTCTSAIIDLELSLSNKSSSKILQVNSEFGF